MKSVKILTLSSIILTFSQSALGTSQEAATSVARDSSECKAIAPFYWEIGDTEKILASGTVGSTYNRDSKLKIASASKFIFGAYVLEKKAGKLTSEEKKFLLMLSGYTSLNPIPCIFRSTVKACFHARNNDQLVTKNVGSFYYNGGHAQSLAINLGLGEMNNAQIANEIKSQLKNKFELEFANPSLAGGARMRTSDYAQFLKEVMKGTYFINKYLGTDAVCTNPATCKTAIYSPANLDWKYSYHHWVELSLNNQVEAYSSPGLMGFYPWISADQKFYGILAREKLGGHNGLDSVVCGQKIRRAFLK